MPRRWPLRAGVLLGIVLAGVLLLPEVRWQAWGRLRGEAFYRGSLTSYCRRALKVHSDTIVLDLRSGLPSPARMPHFQNLFGPWNTPHDSGTPVTDPAALPVLLALPEDEGEGVRAEVAVAVGFHGDGFVLSFALDSRYTAFHTWASRTLPRQSRTSL
jgi:hypothetical protein